MYFDKLKYASHLSINSFQNSLKDFFSTFCIGLKSYAI